LIDERSAEDVHAFCAQYTNLWVVDRHSDASSTGMEVFLQTMANL
jgi:hypothetical protein